MRYSEELIEDIRSRCDIVDVVGEHVRLKRSGSNYFGLCPFHNEKTPSFSVNPDKQMYHCFGCHKSGDVFSFEMEYMNSSFTEAVETLAGRAGITLPEAPQGPVSREITDKKEAYFRVLRQAAAYYHYKLGTPAGKMASAYLEKRGLTEETIRSFGLGVSGKYSDELYRYLRSRGVSESELRDSGLFVVSEKDGFRDRFWNRVMFPICDVRGRVIGFGGRVMGQGEPKYLNSPETDVFNKRRNLFGLHIARTHGRARILLCEGYMDVISVHQAGFQNAVASLGTALTAEQAMLLKRYTKEAVLMYDSDQAGIAAAVRAVPILMDTGLSVKVMSLSPYKDPDECIRAEGAEGLQKRIDAAENGFLFSADQLAVGFDFQDPASKTNFTREIAQRLAAFPDEIERGNYTEAVCRRFRIADDAMRRTVARIAAQGTPYEADRAGRTRNTEKKPEGGVRREKLMLSYLAACPDAYEKTKDLLGPEDFYDPLCRKIADAIYAQLSEGEVSEVRIISSLTDPSERNEASSVFYDTALIGDGKENDRAFTDIVLGLAGRSNELRMNAWNGDGEELRALMKRKALLERYDRENVLIHISDPRIQETRGPGGGASGRERRI